MKSTNNSAYRVTYISRNTETKENKNTKRFLRDRWLPILRVYTHTHTHTQLSERPRSSLYPLAGSISIVYSRQGGTDTTVAYGTAVLKAPIYSRTFLIASHRWELFPGTCRLILRAPLCYRDSLSSRSVASVPWQLVPRSLWQNRWQFLSFVVGSCEPRYPRHSRKLTINARSVDINQLRWQLNADHNERPNRIQ